VPIRAHGARIGRRRWDRQTTDSVPFRLRSAFQSNGIPAPMDCRFRYGIEFPTDSDNHLRGLPNLRVDPTGERLQHNFHELTLLSNSRTCASRLPLPSTQCALGNHSHGNTFCTNTLIPPPLPYSNCVSCCGG